MSGNIHRIKARCLGIEATSEAFVFLHHESAICRSEGFTAHTRVLLIAGSKHLVATLLPVTSDVIASDEAGLSNEAWARLELKGGDSITMLHLDPIESLSLLRSRIYGHELSEKSLHEIIGDIVSGQYSNIHIASFLTACATKPLTAREVLSLTRAMVNAGEKLSWPASMVVDKHSVGGLPGNRTTPIIVSIIAALGLTMPKTSSRAITSPAGTADMMETLAPVDLDVAAIHHVVERTGGCIAWGGAVQLSPADDILIRVERALDIDTQGQMIASVLSKKIAAGATHLVLDIPMGPTAKVRTAQEAKTLADGLLSVGRSFGIKCRALIGDGNQPIGRGIGPALEARDVLAVLQESPEAPQDLRDRAIQLAGTLLELADVTTDGSGASLAAAVLGDGRAWRKFQQICEAQGGMRVPPSSSQRQPLLAAKTGIVTFIDNRKISRLAKLAGAPEAKAAGVELRVKLGEPVCEGDEFCILHAEAPGELEYALDYAAAHDDIFRIESA